MSENDINYAQQLREYAEALLKIADQLEQQADRETMTEPEQSPKAQPRDPQSTSSSQAVTRLKKSQILLSRNKYQTCHIRLPSTEERLPAVAVDGDYYSLLRVFSDIKQVLAAKAKLEWNRDRTVITQMATGYALWVWEPDAEPDSPANEETENPQKNQIDRHENLYLVTISDSQNQAEVSLTEYLLVFNRLSKWANQYLGTAVLVHYWKSTRPELSWLDQFEVVSSGQIICRNIQELSLNVWQEKQLQLWLQRFIQRCRRVIRDFPTPFLGEYKSTQLLANLLDKYPREED
jgi:hypothetical protein